MQDVTGKKADKKIRGFPVFSDIFSIFDGYKPQIVSR